MGYAGSQFHRGPDYLQDPLTPLTPTPPVYENTEQTCENVCAEGTTGDPISVTVPAGTYSSTVSQEDADQQAMEAACSQAAEERISNPCVAAECVWGFGFNISGELGNGTTDTAQVPVNNGTSGWSVQKMGVSHALGIKTNGTLWSWGSNTFGELGLGDTTDRLTPTQVGSDTWIKISAGGEFSYGIKTDGTLWAWGFNGEGQLGQGNLTNLGIPTQVGSDTDWADVSLGGAFALAIKEDGSLWAVGSNDEGQLGLGDIIDRSSFAQVEAATWDSISCGNLFSLGIKTDGTLWGWGSNSRGQLGNGSFGSGVHEVSPIQFGSDADWSMIAANTSASGTTVALKSTGTLWSCGRNNVGQLGVGDTTDYHVLTQIGTDTDWGTLPANMGLTASFALKTDGGLWVWGDGLYIGLGGGHPNELVPVQLGDLLYTTITAYGQNTIVVGECE